jgi:hypothetical protein
MFPPLLRWIAAHANEPKITELILPLDGTAAGDIALAFYARGKRGRALAEAWMRRHARAAANVAIPRALRADKASPAFVDALRWLVGIGRADAVRAAAEEYGVAAAVEAVVGSDPTRHFPPKIPKLPDFVRPAALPPIVHRASGKALSDDATLRVATMLAFSPLDPPYAGLAQVKEACTPESLREHAWGLFQAWLAVGAPPKEAWAMRALAHLGDDEIARRFTPILRAWPGESAAARAVEGVAVLGAIGTDVALLLLSGVAEKVKFASIRDAATEHMEAIARARGLSRDDLADRIVPDLGLDARGETSLDYGPRQFKLELDEHLEPRLVDANGKRVASLPKPGAKDDAGLAKAAQERWKALKKDVKALADARIWRLESAMIARRRWPASEFRALFVEKPVTLQLARRLVWGAYRGDALVATFRVDADRSFADVHDSPFVLPEDATVGVPHPLDLADAAAWAQVLADYELVQPFAQLGRDVHRPTEQERAGVELASTHGLSLSAPRLVFGLEKLRWTRGPAEDGGAFYMHFKALPGTRYEAAIAYEGAVGMGYIEEKEPLTVRSLRVCDGRTHRPLPIAEVDPLVVSEVLRDVRSLAP